MKTVKVKILVVEKEKESTCIYWKQVLDRVSEVFNGDSYRRIEVLNTVDLNEVKKFLKMEFGDLIDIRDSVSGGCYGARTGTVSKGLTLWCDSSLFPERFIDSDFDEVVNLEALCNEYGELTELDADTVHETMEVLGIEAKRDNSYNYLGHDRDSPVDLCHADFSIYEVNEGGALLVIKFHNGGDPRGNYSSEVVYKFEYAEDIFSALYPRLELLNEDHIHEIEKLKEDLWKLEGAERKERIEQIEKLNNGEV